MIKPFAPINVNDYDLSRVQDAVENYARPISNSIIIDGILLEGVALTTGVDNLIETRLGRPWTAWMLARLSANAVVYEGIVQSNKNKFLNLNSTANCTVSLWVI